MPQQDPSFAEGDVKREPQGRAVAIRNSPDPNSTWMVFSAGMGGARLASQWEVEMIESWPNLTVAKK